MRMKRTLIGQAFACLSVNRLSSAPPPVPDLIRDGTKDRQHDRALGPTGLRGRMAGRGLEATDARQMLVITVEEGSPAEGV